MIRPDTHIVSVCVKEVLVGADMLKSVYSKPIALLLSAPLVYFAPGGGVGGGASAA